MAVEHGDLAIAGERGLPGQALDQHAAQRVDVGPAVHRLAPDLLGRHVIDGPHELAGLGQRGPVRHSPDQPEVGQVHVLGPRCLALGQQDVRRLHVAVDQPAVVGRVQRARHLCDDRRRPDRVDGPELADERAEVGPLDVAHGDEQLAVGLAGLVDGDDVRVFERCRGLRLADEPLTEAGILGELGGQDLEGDPPFQPVVQGQIDDAHPPAPEHRLDAISSKFGSDGDVRVDPPARVYTCPSPLGRAQSRPASDVVVGPGGNQPDPVPGLEGDDVSDGGRTRQRREHRPLPPVGRPRPTGYHGPAPAAPCRRPRNAR